MNKFLLELNQNYCYCSEGCCSDHWCEPELWLLDKNGMPDEQLFQSYNWTGITSWEDDCKFILEQFNEFHGLDLVLTMENCIIS
jgi:hypothetical protein